MSPTPKLRLARPFPDLVKGGPVEFERPAEGVDQLPQLAVELGQDGHHLFRLRGLRERGEAPEVAEDDRDLASVALQHALVIVVHDQLGELR